MFSSRNIHFAILGLILGASAGYVYAFVRADKAVVAESSQGAMPDGHPNVGNTQMLDAIKEAVEQNPTDPELMARYATALYDAGRVSESEQWLDKAVKLNPKDAYTRSMHGAALWQLGRKDEAQAELEAGLQQDPNHIPSLHGLFMLAIEKNDRARATQLLGRIEKTEPGYEAIPALKNRFREAFGPAQ